MGSLKVRLMVLLGMVAMLLVVLVPAASAQEEIWGQFNEADCVDWDGNSILCPLDASLFGTGFVEGDVDGDGFADFDAFEDQLDIFVDFAEELEEAEEDLEEIEDEIDEDDDDDDDDEIEKFFF